MSTNRPKRIDRAALAAIPYLFLLLVAFILLKPVITREASFLMSDDNRHQTYCFMYKLATSIHRGYLPIWDADTYGGKNFPGEFQAGIFYPLNIALCLLFGSINGIDPYYLDLLLVLHYFICLMGMYALARVFKLTIPASIVSALIFSFTGVLGARAGAQANIFLGLCLMPWPLYFLASYYQGLKKKKNLVFAGLVAGLQILSGHIQPFFHTMLIGIIMILFYEYQNKKDWGSFSRSVLANVLIILVIVIIISLPQLYYSVQYMSRCYRWVGSDQPLAPGQKVPFHIYAFLYTIKPSDLGNLLGMNYNRPADDNVIYMGVLPLFLLIAYLIKCRFLSLPRESVRLTRLLLIIALIGFVSIWGYLTFFSVILWETPFVTTIRELGRYSLLLLFSFSLLVGLAITHIGALRGSVFEHSRRIKWVILAILAVNMIYLVFFQTRMINRQVSIPFLCAFLFFLLLMRTTRPLLIEVTLIAFVLIDLSLNRVGYVPAHSPMYPTAYFQRNRIIDFLEKSYGKYRVDYEIGDNDSLRRNIGDIYRIQTKLGYCATMNMRYFDYISSDWSLHSEVLDLLNIRYIVSDKKLDSTFSFVDSLPHTYLYERKDCYPRVFWKSQIGMPREEIAKENAIQIHPVAYSDLYTRTDVRCESPDTLIFSENNYPGWICFDNGKKIPIYMPAIKDHPPLFRAIALEKGFHRIEFRYPTIFRWR